MLETERQSEFAALTVQLLSAYLANNTVASEDIAALIRTTGAALVEVAAPSAAEPQAPTYTPAVSVRKSLASPDHLISMVDGKPYKTLKRHLATHGLTPEAYRSRYGLPASYPMVAPNFAARRREIAEKIGLGNRRAQAAIPAAEVGDTSTSTSGDAPSKPTRSSSRKAKAPAKTSSSAGLTSNDTVESSRKPIESAAAAIAAPLVVEPSVTSAPVPAERAERAAEEGPKKRGRPAGKGKAVAKPAAVAMDVAAAEKVPETASGNEEPAKPSKARGKLGLFGKAPERKNSQQGNVPETDLPGVSTAAATTAVASDEPRKTSKKPAGARRMARSPKSAVPVEAGQEK